MEVRVIRINLEKVKELYFDKFYLYVSTGTSEQKEQIESFLQKDSIYLDLFEDPSFISYFFTKISAICFTIKSIKDLNIKNNDTLQLVIQNIIKKINSIKISLIVLLCPSQPALNQSQTEGNYQIFQPTSEFSFKNTEIFNHFKENKKRFKQILGKTTKVSKDFRINFEKFLHAKAIESIIKHLSSFKVIKDYKFIEVLSSLATLLYPFMNTGIDFFLMIEIINQHGSKLDDAWIVSHDKLVRFIGTIFSSKKKMIEFFQKNKEFQKIHKVIFSIISEKPKSLDLYKNFYNIQVETIFSQRFLNDLFSIHENTACYFLSVYGKLLPRVIFQIDLFEKVKPLMLNPFFLTIGSEKSLIRKNEIGLKSLEGIESLNAVIFIFENNFFLANLSEKHKIFYKIFPDDQNMIFLTPIMYSEGVVIKHHSLFKILINFQLNSFNLTIHFKSPSRESYSITSKTSFKSSSLEKLQPTHPSINKSSYFSIKMHNLNTRSPETSIKLSQDSHISIWSSLPFNNLSTLKTLHLSSPNLLKISSLKFWFDEKINSNLLTLPKLI